MNIIRSVYNYICPINRENVGERIGHCRAYVNVYPSFWLNLKIWWLGKDIEELGIDALKNDFLNLVKTAHKTRNVWSSICKIENVFKQDLAKRTIRPIEEVQKQEKLNRARRVLSRGRAPCYQKDENRSPNDRANNTNLINNIPNNFTPQFEGVVPPEERVLEVVELEEVEEEKIDKMENLFREEGIKIISQISPELKENLNIENVVVQLIKLIFECKLYQQEKKMSLVQSTMSQIRNHKDNLLEHLTAAGVEGLAEEFNNKVSTVVGNLAKSVIENKQKKLILSCRKGKELPASDTDAFEQVRLACVNEMQMITRINAQVEAVLEFAKLPSCYQTTYKIKLVHAGNGDNPVRIKVSNPLLGYSMHLLLSGIDLVRTRIYNGDTLQWDLSVKDAEKLNNHLSNLLKWQSDSELIVGELLSDQEESRNYIPLGLKPLSEIIKNPLRLTPNFVKRLKQIEDQKLPCLLFNQVSIDLTTYPSVDAIVGDALGERLSEEEIEKRRLEERQYIKDLFEEFYNIENMVGANNKPKKFIEDDPWRSVLNIKQLEQICPHLNKQLKFKQIITEYTKKKLFYGAVQALKNLGLNELATFAQYKAGILREAFYKAFAGIPQAQDALSKRVGLILGAAQPGRNIMDLESTCMNQFDDLLTQFTGPYFKQQEKFYQVTPSEIEALYPRGRDANQVGVVVTEKNIRQLFEQLKNQPDFAAPEAQESLQRFEEGWMLRFKGGRKDGYELRPYAELDTSSTYYGQQNINAALMALESYVAKIVYKAKTKITKESIADSLIAIQATGDDVLYGCANGFCGRVEDIGRKLIYGNQTPFQNYINKVMHDCLTAAVQNKMIHDAGSAHRSTEFETIQQYLMNYVDDPMSSYSGFNKSIKGIFYTFSLNYTPKKIYTEAYTYFKNRFWELSLEGNDEEIYSLLKHLGFGEDNDELDKKYRAFGEQINRWQYSYFQQDLPKYLINYLIQSKYLFAKEQGSWASSRENECSVVIPQVHNVAPEQVNRINQALNEGFHATSNMKGNQALGVTKADKRQLEQTNTG